MGLQGVQIRSTGKETPKTERDTTTLKKKGHTSHLKGAQRPPQALKVLVGERREDGHGVLGGLALRTHVLVDVVGLALQDAHAAPVVPVLATVAADVEPAGRRRAGLGEGHATRF